MYENEEGLLPTNVTLSSDNNLHHYSQNFTTWDDEWLVVAKCWITFLVFFGGLGNLFTVAAIFHQMILHKRVKRVFFTNARNSLVSSSRKKSNQWYAYYSTPSSVVNLSNSAGSDQRNSPKHPKRVQAPKKALSRNVGMRIQADTILLAHLIFCDFLYCAINLPHTLYVYGFQDYPKESPVLCSLAAFFRYVNAFAEWMTLGLLTVQRCVDLTKPPNARFFRTRTTLLFIAAIWIISVLIQVGNIFHGRYGFSEERHKCDILGSKSSMLFFFMIDSILPCGLMLFGCFSIIFQIMRNKRRLQKMGVSPDVVAERAKKMWQSAALMLGLLCIFLMCVIPLCIHNVLFVLGVHKSFKWEVIVYMIYWCEYGINFVVYAVRKRKYRRAYRDFFSDLYNLRKWCRKKPAPAKMAATGCVKMAVSSGYNCERHSENGIARGASVSVGVSQRGPSSGIRSNGTVQHAALYDARQKSSPPDLLIGHQL